MAKENVYYATGRRKTSAARVFLKDGSGKVEINGKPADEFLATPGAKAAVAQAFQVTDTQKKFDAYVTVSGGGTTGQADAIRHGIARALVTADETLRLVLKKAGFLRRDSRMVERKKYGKHKARRSTQFSKR
jgi:small subunit ribosomal protein S9